ncbi:MAG: hypothetical protein DI537_01640 [Stutzerimonas stutzeri]|nr:MAG: hypothetical protein DI537_01640 [Stutzerimonas stutzeri]
MNSIEDSAGSGDAGASAESAGATKKSLSPEQGFIVELTGIAIKEAHRAAIGKWEVAFYCGAILLIYLLVVSPPWQPFSLVSGFTIALILATGAVAWSYEARSAKRADAVAKSALAQAQLSLPAPKETSGRERQA